MEVAKKKMAGLSGRPWVWSQGYFVIKQKELRTLKAIHWQENGSFFCSDYERSAGTCFSFFQLTIPYITWDTAIPLLCRYTDYITNTDVLVIDRIIFWFYNRYVSNLLLRVMNYSNMFLFPNRSRAQYMVSRQGCVMVVRQVGNIYSIGQNENKSFNNTTQ